MLPKYRQEEVIANQRVEPPPRPAITARIRSQSCMARRTNRALKVVNADIRLRHSYHVSRRSETTVTKGQPSFLIYVRYHMETVLIVVLVLFLGFCSVVAGDTLVGAVARSQDERVAMLLDSIVLGFLKAVYPGFECDSARV
jgi:hypothetical protein